MKPDVIVRMAAMFVVATLAAGCDGSGGPRTTVTGEVELTSQAPVAVVEFEGNLVLTTFDDDIVANFSRIRPNDDSDLERANVGAFTTEVWIDDAWVDDEDGLISVPLAGPGPSTVRYRWTFELAPSAESGTVPIEAGLTPVYSPSGVTNPGEDDVPTVTLQISSVTYP